MTSKVPLAIGTVLWLGATCLLLDDAWHQGHATASHLMMPVLTSGTVAAAVMAHHRIASLRLLSGLGFLLLALLGSSLTVYSTLGRTAEARDLRASAAEATNRSLGAKQQALLDARRLAAEAEAEVQRECRTGFGRNCEGWRRTLADRQSDARRIEAELSSMSASPVDPRGDAVVRIASLLGASDGARVRVIVAALDPAMLPLFLELGSILFFAAGIPHAKPRETVSPELETDGDDEETVEEPWSQEEALADLQALTARGIYMDQRFLAMRWVRSKGTVSRWMSGWESDRLVARQRNGKSKLPTAAPRNA